LTVDDLVLDFSRKEVSYALDPELASKGNTTYARMCPATEYWQDFMANMADKVVNEIHFDGIYYDVIGAINAEPCYDRRHNHPMGGGHHYQKGNIKMLQDAKQKIQKNNGLVFTEYQDENYIGSVDLILSILSYRRGELPFVGDSKGAGRELESYRYKTVPAYQSIYDGFVMYAGHDMNGTYWQNPEEFGYLSAGQFVMGGQMGYAGMDLIPKPNVTNPKDDHELAYLSKLSHAKRTINPYFLHGRVQRELPDQPHVPPKTMMALPWLSKDKSSLLIPITSPLAGKEGSFDVDMLLDLTRYGFDAKDAS
jgi:hypothetical protein